MCLLHYSTDSISCGNEIRTLSISVFHPLQASWNNSVTTWAKLMKFAYILHVKRTKKMLLSKKFSQKYKVKNETVEIKNKNII